MQALERKFLRISRPLKKTKTLQLYLRAANNKGER